MFGWFTFSNIDGANFPLLSGVLPLPTSVIISYQRRAGQREADVQHHGVGVGVDIALQLKHIALFYDTD